MKRLRVALVENRVEGILRAKCSFSDPLHPVPTGGEPTRTPEAASMPS
jgi:hypothetical protein